MKKSLYFLLLPCIFTYLSISPAYAGPYFSGNVGLVFVDDSELSLPSENSGQTRNSDLSFDDGFAVTAAVGNALENGLRFEFELGYRKNDMDKLSSDGNSLSLNGDFSTISGMLNAFYNFKQTPDKISPFIGAGFGVANIKADIEDIDSDDETVYAYQLAAGIAFPLDDITVIDVQYRYLETEDPEFFDAVESTYSTHNILVGIRFR